MTTKPPYAVPSMDAIRALPWNGLTVASLFCGCGGSSLGYRMAGFRVLYANEFVEAARDSYRANCADYTVIDDRDVRTVTPASILKMIGLARGELDLLDGSPPCASFSLAGRRQKAWGKSKAYSDTTQRSDDLFFEFARILRGIKPKAFVAENVSGLVRGVAKGYFIEILAALRACGYRVNAKLLDAQWLGVPQARQRLIFVGVRNDLRLEPAHPKPLGYRYSIRDALPWIAGAATKRGSLDADDVAPTVVTHGREHTHSELVAHVGGIRDSGYLKDQRLSVDEPAHSTRRGRPVPLDEPAPTVMAGKADRDATRQFEIRQGPGSAHSSARGEPLDVDDPAPTILARGDGPHGRRDRTDQFAVVLAGDAQPNKPGNSFPRGTRISADEPVPTVMASVGIVGSAPHHLEGAADAEAIEHGLDISAYAIGEEYDKLSAGEQSDRYFQLVKPDADGPSPTIVASSGEFKSSASVVHPVEKRKFSIAELRRLCAFPDDFVLTGSYGQQWERLGRAVPPVMMAAIAATVRDEVLLAAVAAQPRRNHKVSPKRRKAVAKGRRAPPAKRARKPASRKRSNGNGPKR